MSGEQTGAIRHELHPFLPGLREFDSTRSLEESPLYRELAPRILKVLNSYELVELAPHIPADTFYRCVAWNVERGMEFEAILHFLKHHPLLKSADIILATETDLGMARSGNRNVAAEFARELKMNYFFVPSYLNLAKGCGVEREVEGENEIGIHGNAIFSRYPITHPRLQTLPNAYDKMRGREKRIGSQRALLATIDLGKRRLQVGCAHLDVRSTQHHRRLQLERVMTALQEQKDLPAIVGGDWNTSTYDSHSALSSIIGFWLRVVFGVGRMIRHHYPHPDRLFERRLFRMLETKGFDYKGCNALGVGTTHFSIEDIKQFKNLREWLPHWCFRCLEWSLKDFGGRCSFKLDWFAQRGLRVVHDGEMHSDRKGTSISPQVISNLVHAGRSASDHDAIVVDVVV